MFKKINMKKINPFQAQENLCSSCLADYHISDPEKITEFLKSVSYKPNQSIKKDKFDANSLIQNWKQDTEEYL